MLLAFDHLRTQITHVMLQIVNTAKLVDDTCTVKEFLDEYLFAIHSNTTAGNDVVKSGSTNCTPPLYTQAVFSHVLPLNHSLPYFNYNYVSFKLNTMLSATALLVICRSDITIAGTRSCFLLHAQTHQLYKINSKNLSVYKCCQWRESLV